MKKKDKRQIAITISRFFLGVFNDSKSEFTIVKKNPKSTEIKNLGNLKILFQKVYI